MSISHSWDSQLPTSHNRRRKAWKPHPKKWFPPAFASLNLSTVEVKVIRMVTKLWGIIHEINVGSEALSTIWMDMMSGVCLLSNVSYIHLILIQTHCFNLHYNSLFLVFVAAKLFLFISRSHDHMCSISTLYLC